MKCEWGIKSEYLFFLSNKAEIKLEELSSFYSTLSKLKFSMRFEESSKSNE